MNKPVLTPDERARLAHIAALVRAASSGLTFSVEVEDGIDEETGRYYRHSYGQLKAGGGRVMATVNKDFQADGELFAAARGEIAWLLRLVARLSDGGG